jgi:hypothetical protein
MWCSCRRVRASPYFANLRGGVDPDYQSALIQRLDIDPPL